MRNLWFLIALLVVGATVALAQSAVYDNIATQVNVGDFGWGTFIYGHGVNGQPGTTELRIQCDFHRAELITNFDVYGQQMTSQFFAVTCTPTGAHSYVLNGTPLNESLVMTGTDANGQTITENLNLSVNSASWQVTGIIGPRCFVVGACKASGSAEIAY